VTFLLLQLPLYLLGLPGGSRIHAALFIIFVSPASYSKLRLEAQPAAIVTPGVNVTLRCSAPQPAGRFALFKSAEVNPLFLQDVSTELAEFFLEEVTPAQGGRYHCCYRKTDWGLDVWSQSSDILELLVTGEGPGVREGEGAQRWGKGGGKRGTGTQGDIGERQSWVGRLGNSGAHRRGRGRDRLRSLSSHADQLPRPSLVALPGPVVVRGANVSLRCAGQVSGMSFALYRVGVAAPLQYRDSKQPWADFLLPGDLAPGTYSCYYHTPSAPYVLSQRSQPLVISLEGKGPQDPEPASHPSPVPALLLYTQGSRTQPSSLRPRGPGPSPPLSDPRAQSLSSPTDPVQLGCFPSPPL
jgi:hypothetical protein